jgi:hypothetical protein
MLLRACLAEPIEQMINSQYMVREPIFFHQKR